jgi:hypothetical protein
VEHVNEGNGAERRWRVPPAQLIVKAGAAIAFAALAADDEGVTLVTGYAGRRHLPWQSVREIRVDERRRLLLQSRLLEIETDDDLFLFSAFDLGEDVRETAEELQRLRARADH